MHWEISKSPSNSILKVYLDSGEEVSSELGSMVLMKGPISVRTHTGRVASALKRAIAGGESLFINTYRAEAPSEIWIAPPIPGDITYIRLNNTSYIIQDFGYLAHHRSKVKITTAWRGFKGLLAGGGGLVWLKLEGYGGVWVNAFGGIERVGLGHNESVVIDNFHVVALSSTVDWNIRKFGGMKYFLLGGEGIVINLKGPGEVFVQTRSVSAFAASVRRVRRVSDTTKRLRNQFKL